MGQIIWSPQAIADLEAIGDFIARESPQYAQILVDRIYEAVDRLLDFPLSGRVVPEIGEKVIREILFKGYRIVYIMSEDEKNLEVKVLTVFHSSVPFG